MAKVNTTTKVLNLERYSGRWVALSRGRVIASGRSLENLMAEVKQLKLKVKPTVLLVPRKDEGPYILICL